MGDLRDEFCELIDFEKLKCHLFNAYTPALDSFAAKTVPPISGSRFRLVEAGVGCRWPVIGSCDRLRYYGRTPGICSELSQHHCMWNGLVFAFSSGVERA